eukprot:29307-Pelagococcus_subviridis.AAC.5
MRDRLAGGFHRSVVAVESSGNFDFKPAQRAKAPRVVVRRPQRTALTPSRALAGRIARAGTRTRVERGERGVRSRAEPEARRAHEGSARAERRDPLDYQVARSLALAHVVALSRT